MNQQPQTLSPEASAMLASSEVEAYVAFLSFPGQVFHVSYLKGQDDIRLWHILDVDFFRAWLHHPRFHLIK